MSDWRTDTFHSDGTAVTRYMNVRTGETVTLDADQTVTATRLGLILRRFLSDAEVYAEVDGSELVLDGRVPLAPSEVELIDRLIE